MQIKFLKDIVSRIAGGGSVRIVDLLYGEENVNEFLIAKKLKITINQARNILYKLAEEGLVDFIRKKDKKNGGWYTYFWTFNIKRSLQVLKNKLEGEIKNHGYDLAIKQSKQFYYCQNCNLEYNDEDSLLNNYACPECGEVLIMKNNQADIDKINLEINRLKKDFDFVNVEIGKITEIEEFAKGRKLKADERKKKKERAEKRVERDKLKKKMEKQEKNKKIKIKSKKIKKDTGKKNKRR